MFFNLPLDVILFVVLAVLAFACLARSFYWARRARSYQRDLTDEQAERDKLSDVIILKNRALGEKDRELALRGKAIDDLQERIKGLEGSLSSREAEVTRLQRLVTKAEQAAKDAREERDNQTNRANDESVSRFNAQADLARARTGEDPETDTFYAKKYAVHIAVGLDADTVAAVAAESDSGAAAETAAEEVAPAEAEAKPQTAKKPRTKR